MEAFSALLSKTFKYNFPIYALVHAALVWAALHAKKIAPAQFPPLDIRLGYTADEALSVMRAYKPDGRHAVAFAEVRLWAGALVGRGLQLQCRAFGLVVPSLQLQQQRCSTAGARNPTPSIPKPPTPQTQIVDFAFMAAYSIMLASLMALALVRLRAPAHCHSALLVPFAAGAVDALENALMLRLMLGKAGPTKEVAQLVAVVSKVKWVLVGASVLLVAFSGAMVFYKVVLPKFLGGAKKKAAAAKKK